MYEIFLITNHGVIGSYGKPFETCDEANDALDKVIAKIRKKSVEIELECPGEKNNQIYESDDIARGIAIEIDDKDDRERLLAIAQMYRDQYLWLQKLREKS